MLKRHPIKAKKEKLIRKTISSPIKYTSVAGIYKIECTETKSVYIGQSQSLDNRIKNHKSALINRRHIVQVMQDEYNRHGDKYFIFEVIHESDEQNLLQLESFYIQQYKDSGYIIYNNIHHTDSMSMVNCHKDHREILQKLSDLLEKGTIKVQELEQSIFYKENQW